MLNLTFFRLVQLLKVPKLNVAFLGIVIVSRFVQPEKATSPIEVTLSGIVMLVNCTQPLKEYSPIEVTLSGIVMLVSPMQP